MQGEKIATEQSIIFNKLMTIVLISNKKNQRVFMH